MQILVDADACPVKEIIVRLAMQRSIPVTMLIDTSHELNDGYSTVVIVDKQADSVDFATHIMGTSKKTYPWNKSAIVASKR